MEDTTARAPDGFSLDGLAALQREFPAFRIWQEAAGVRVRYVARGLRLGTRPYAVVTGDLAELRAALVASGGQETAAMPCDPAVPNIARMRDTSQRALSEYPQAIADDYPGWDITCDDGEWAARCPALTVCAPTSAALRAAIERAIGDGAPGEW